MKYAVLFITVFLILLCGCRHRGPAELVPAETYQTVPTAEYPGSDQSETTMPCAPEDTPSSPQKAQLLCSAENQEQAEEIAVLYGIELANYYHGLATYFTEEDPLEVIRRGEEQGWPPLYLNSNSQLH